MPVSMYAASVPVYANILNHLAETLDKAAAHAETSKVKPEVLIGARLYPNMWSLAEQVRATCNHATRGPARIAGLPIPQFEGKDETFADLKARVAWALAFVNGLGPDQFADAAERTVTFPAGDRQVSITGEKYLLFFSMPNFYFHATAAYAILRHSGVPLHKADFMGDM
jgi:uncharacterized protein